jgi:hypothetical protein
MKTTTTESHAPFDPRHPVALAIYCSDGRFTRAVEELLAAHGRERLDTLTLPGGPALLNLSALPSERDTIARATRFLIHGHALIEVVLVAHQGCGYYRARHPTRKPDEVRAMQLADLRGAANVLTLEHPRLAVTAWYAHVTGERLRFESVALKAP